MPPMCRLGLHLGHILIRDPERILPVHHHAVADVADRGQHGELGLVRGVGKLYGFHAVDYGLLRGIVSGL